jgi:chemotaxis methyl-accepting protein methylase
LARSAYPAETTTFVRRADPSADDLLLLSQALAVVRERTGLDFAGHRKGTLLRRVRNRMISVGERTLADYVLRLRREPGEAAALVERLTIKVSRFFRDRRTFELLRSFVSVRRAATAGGSLRVWSAGCGHGEEAYSLAILLEDLGEPPEALVLATDVDPAALAQARSGRYPLAALRELDDEALARHFATPPGRAETREVTARLRARVEFRQHDLAGDPPPTGFDLVCCRNVLIYLEPPAQLDVLRRLEQALVPGGLLCLGEAEWLLPPLARGFDLLDRKGRLFRKLPLLPHEGHP